MLGNLLYRASRLHPVHQVTTPAEKQAVLRSRFEIVERGAKARDGDPAVAFARDPGLRVSERLLWDPEDDHDDAALFYVGEPQAMEGSVRVIAYAPGRVPADVRRRYSLHRFPDLDRRAICVVDRLMLKASARGSTTVVALTGHALDHTVRAHRVDCMFASCAPGSLRAYRKLGLRAYSGQLLSHPTGMMVPLIGITADLQHARKVGSPWLPILKKLKADGAWPSMDPEPLVAVVDAANDEHEPSDDTMAAEVDRAFEETGQGFLNALPETTRRRLESGGYLREVTHGSVLVRTGELSTDIYVILLGAFEVEQAGRHLAMLGPGDLFGEVAFFRDSGRRSATVKALTNGRVLVLSPGFLRDLEAKVPSEAVAVYKALGARLAERLAAR